MDCDDSDIVALDIQHDHNLLSGQINDQWQQAQYGAATRAKFSGFENFDLNKREAMNLFILHDQSIKWRVSTFFKHSQWTSTKVKIVLPVLAKSENIIEILAENWSRNHVREV